MTTTYSATPPTRAELDRSSGPLLVEFGANWCGICQAAQPAIAQALRAYPAVQHIKVADASGQPLGRSFGVKLWPTLIALRDGRELARLVRPTSTDAIVTMLSTSTSDRA
jgi:thioredoxin 1